MGLHSSNDIAAQLQEQISNAKQELLTTIEQYMAQHGADKAFDALCSRLQGYNEDGELFDFSYDVRYGGYDIITTITFRDGKLSLADDCEVWRGSNQLESHYNWQTPEASTNIKDDTKTERISVLDAIRADREKPRQLEAKTEKTKSRTEDER